MTDAPRHKPEEDGPGGDELDPERSFAQTWREPPPPPAIPELLKERPEDSRRKTASETPAQTSLSSMGRAWGMAMDFIFTILAGAGLGWLIGRWQGHVSGWVLGGLAVGFAAALVRIIRATQKQERAERAAAERRKGR